MPQNITESASWDTPLTTFSDGDGVNGTNFLTHEQKIANRLKYIGDRIGVAGSPSPKVKRFADIAGLKAVNPGTDGYATGDIVWISGTQYFGPYQYDSTSSATEDTPWIIQPTTGSGRWISVFYDFRPRGGSANDVTTRSISAAAYTDVSGTSVTVTGGVAGDIVEVEASAVFKNNGAGTPSTSYVRAVVVDGAATTTAVGPEMQDYTDAGAQYHSPSISARFVLPASGTCTVKLQSKIAGSGGNALDIRSTCVVARLVKDAG